MQLGFSPDLFFIVLVVLSTTFILLEILKRNKTHYHLLPPGPPKLPLLGNIHQLASSSVHRRLRDLATRYGPIMHLQLGEVSTIIISSPDAAKEVLKTHDIIFASRPRFIAITILTYGCKDIVMAPYGNHWRQRKKICVEELFTLKQVCSFQSIRDEQVLAVIKLIALGVGSVINLSDKIFSISMGITTKAAFGKRSNDQEKIVSLLKETTVIGSGFCLADMFPSNKLFHLMSIVRYRAEKLHQMVDPILEKIIADHKIRKMDEDGESNKDLVDILLDTQSEYGLTINDIKAIILDIFLAGTETTVTTIEWAMSEMLKNSGMIEKAQEEVRRICDGKGTVDETSLEKLQFLKLVVKETLRLHPPVPLLIPRESTERCQIYGYELPAKARVLVNAWAIGRDPMMWKEADKFDPDRFLKHPIDFKGQNFEYIPFGAGRRICPGIGFGLATVELSLASLLYHFDWSLPGGVRREDLDMTETFGLSMRRKNDLYLVPTCCPCSS
ncbi:hypothetical protein Ancab_040398 [Ancistrocladus abbreviatus]